MNAGMFFQSSVANGNYNSKERTEGLMFDVVLLIEEILHHLTCMKPCKQCDIYHINRCRISSINSTTHFIYVGLFQKLHRDPEIRWFLGEFPPCPVTSARTES